MILLVLALLAEPVQIADRALVYTLTAGFATLLFTKIWEGHRAKEGRKWLQEDRQLAIDAQAKLDKLDAISTNIYHAVNSTLTAAIRKEATQTRLTAVALRSIVNLLTHASQKKQTSSEMAALIAAEQAASSAEAMADASEKALADQVANEILGRAK